MRSRYPQLIEILLRQGLEFLQIVLGIELFLDDRRLANDAVEEVTVFGHASARRRAQIVLRMHQNVAISVDADAKLLRHQDFEAVGHTPGLPVSIAVSERC